jgi:hypothetical protein
VAELVGMGGFVGGDGWLSRLGTDGWLSWLGMGG